MFRRLKTTTTCVGPTRVASAGPKEVGAARSDRPSQSRPRVPVQGGRAGIRSSHRWGVLCPVPHQLHWLLRSTCYRRPTAFFQALLPTCASPFWAYWARTPILEPPCRFRSGVSTTEATLVEAGAAIEPSAHIIKLTLNFRLEEDAISLGKRGSNLVALVP